MNIPQEIFEEIILDHNRNPHNFEHVNHKFADHTAYGFNPVCSDEFWINLKMDGDVICDTGFEGAGCSMSTASVSLMLQSLKGRNVQEAEELFEKMHHLLTDANIDANEFNDLGKLQVLAGVRAHPTRIKCVTLGWHLLHAALNDNPSTICTE
ncbi:MAG: SUF system NifU family Fe-S cluster assembly protein [Magnetococcales bacterium]|nr:SUF system NifU family Fe-S cluster assembly protein [Magnetococcales bacterium]